MGPAGAEVLVGVAGWDYQDWRGAVVDSSAEDALPVVARHLDLVEVNVTFYRAVPARTAADWLRRVEPYPRFRFSLKADRRLTHERARRPDPDALASVATAARPLADAGRLVAVLAQFPPSFRFVPASFDYLRALVDAAPAGPLVVEPRHASWQTPEARAALASLRVSVCAVDMPPVADAMRREPPTGPVGYLRLHGRNLDAWSERGAPPERVYDHLYGEDDVAEFVREIAAWREARGREVVAVVANNHVVGKAFVNALELLSALRGGAVPVPEPLLRRYPRLSRIAANPPRTLFPL